MSTVTIQGVSKAFGTNTVLREFSEVFKDGEFVTLLGPSGCGKTTMLRIIAGFERPTAGEVYIDDQLVSGAKTFVQPEKRNIGMVFQSYAVWPHMNVFDNVAYPLTIKKTPKATIKEKVDRVLDIVHLSQYAERFPNQLSGGQQQRVALARALVAEPRLLLLDEPLSNLDAKLRVDMRSELKRLHIETGTTMIYVTHDQTEALTMSTKVAIFREGVIIQVAPPLEMYNNPCNLYVADFVGNPRINFVEAEATYDAGGMHVAGPLGKLDFARSDMTEDAPTSGSGAVVLGVRPEQLTIGTGRMSPSDIEAKIYTSMPAGSETLITVKTADTSMVIKALGITHYNPNETVYLALDPHKMNVFDKESQRLIKYSR